MVVRDTKFNYGDHRLLEYKIFKKEPGIKLIRCKFTDIHKNATLDNEMKLF